MAQRDLGRRRGGEPADARRIVAGPAPRRRTRDVDVYLNNDAMVHAPFDALRLARRLGVTWAPLAEG